MFGRCPFLPRQINIFFSLTLKQLDSYTVTYAEICYGELRVGNTICDVFYKKEDEKGCKFLQNFYFICML